MATHTTVQSGLWSAAGTWDANGVPVDNGVVVIAAGHAVEFDVDMSNAGTWPNGIAGLTITSVASGTPAMLFCKYSADGTYHLKIKTGTTIVGSSNTVLGRILANSDGVWGNTGALPYGRKFIIDLQTTAYINAQYLAIDLRCTNPATLYATTYGTKYTVSSVNTGTNVLTTAAPHGWPSARQVMFKTSGTMPAGLREDTLYYLSNASGSTFQLAHTATMATQVDITSDSWTGTLEVFDGHQSIVTDTMNVFEDLRAVEGWVTTDGHDSVVLVNTAYANIYDAQRLGLVAINAGTIQLSANVDSIQYPGARIYMASRNISIRCNNTAESNLIINGSNNYYQNEFRGTAGQGVSQTTFYGYGAHSSIGCTFAGSMSGLTRGESGPFTPTSTGIIVGCNTAIQTPNGGTFSGTVAGCQYAVAAGQGHTFSGYLCGGSYAYNGGANCRFTGTARGLNAFLSGAHPGLILDVGSLVHGVGLITTATAPGIICRGTVRNSAGVLTWGRHELEGSTFIENGTYDLSNADVRGYNAILGSASPVLNWKHASTNRVEERYGVCIQDYQGVSGALGFWNAGGKTISAAYSAGTHGTPPIASSLIHEMTFEDSTRVNWVELPIWGVAGVPLTVTMYGKLTGTAAFLTRPSISICDPSKPWQDPTEVLNASTMAANTDWQTLTATYTPTYDRELRIRVQGIGGNAGGTGTEKLYWFHKVNGPTPKVIGSPIIKGGRSW